MKKLLVANRGEIAVRVFRTARELGLKTVAIASDSDLNSLHAKFADELVALEGKHSSETYLDIEKVIAAAKKTGADAIHPGYGFLSERPEFVDACDAAGITFVGPSGAAMRRLGSKIEAKRLAREVGIPIAPGFFEPGASMETLRTEAAKIGYPVLLKASAGGGGRGMRAVHAEAEFEGQFRLASDEALKAFGDDEMMVEKLVVRPRHVETQVLADAHGSVAVLFERECSIQRRRQKLIEEAPAPRVSDDLWRRMREASIALIRAAGYVGAGTVETLVDEANDAFYFLEVNARLQVEHPVTESITGLDLVRQQLRIAQGERLELPEGLMSGDRASIRGASIEARIVAEDPAQGFLPSVGKILAWAEPQGPGIRVDTGFGPGGEVSPYFDSLIAKVIVHAETRALAIERLRAALLDFHVLGIKTNIGYLLELLDHPAYRSGDLDIEFLDREFSDWSPSGEIPAELAAIAAAASSPALVAIGAKRQGPWDLTDGFRNVRA